MLDCLRYHHPNCSCLDFEQTIQPEPFSALRWSVLLSIPHQKLSSCHKHQSPLSMCACDSTRTRTHLKLYCLSTRSGTMNHSRVPVANVLSLKDDVPQRIYRPARSRCSLRTEDRSTRCQILPKNVPEARTTNHLSLLTDPQHAQRGSAKKKLVWLPARTVHANSQHLKS